MYQDFQLISFFVCLLLQIPSHFDDSGLLRQSAKLLSLPLNNDIPYFHSPLWAAGFSFSDSTMIQEVPYSSALPFLFFGEEISMAARLDR
jgi:[Skp1-protein]-hydroxyproline N-acetylglucosaminyltransferase